MKRNPTKNLCYQQNLYELNNLGKIDIKNFEKI